MAKKSTSKASISIQIAGKNIVFIGIVVVSFVLGIVVGKTLLKTKSTYVVTTQSSVIDVLTYEELVNSYKNLVDEYNTVAKSDASHIAELNALAPVVNTNGIKPEGAGADYFAMTYVPPLCKQAVKSQSPSPLSQYQSYVTVPTPCD